MRGRIAAGLAALVLTYGCSDDVPKPVSQNTPVKYKTTEAGPQVPAHSESAESLKPGQVSLRYEYSGLDRVRAINVEVHENVRLAWSDYVPVFATVPGTGVQQHFEVENGNREVRVEFPQAFYPGGKNFIIHGLHTQTREEKILYRRSLDELLPETRER